MRVLTRSPRRAWHATLALLCSLSCTAWSSAAPPKPAALQEWAAPPKPEAPPKPAAPPQRHVGEGWFSGWKTAHLVEGGLFGVEPRVTRTIAPRAAPATDAGALVDTHLQIVMRSWYPDQGKTLRFSFDGALGADSSGLAGAIAHEGMAGVRLALTLGEGEGAVPNALRGSPGYRAMDEDLRRSLRSVFAASPHALVARVGYRVHALGNQAFYDSRVELPRAEVGYAYDAGAGARSFGLEARAEGGLVLAGALHVGEAERRLGATVSWGGRLLLHATEHLHAELAVSRLEDPRSKIGTPIDTVATLSCLRIGAPRRRFGATRTSHGQTFVRAVCGAVRVESGELLTPRGELGRATAATAGILVSLPWIDP